MFKKLKELRSREEGFSMVEILVSISLLGIVMVSVGNPLFTGSKMMTEAQDRDTTQRQEATAVELRHVWLAAHKCIADYDSSSANAGPFRSGNYFQEITEEHIAPCMSALTVPTTLQYEIKRSGANNLCVVGYDTTRNTDRYTIEDPYIYYGPQAIVHRDMPTPCGYSTAEGVPFNWEEMN